MPSRGKVGAVSMYGESGRHIVSVGGKVKGCGRQSARPTANWVQKASETMFRAGSPERRDVWVFILFVSAVQVTEPRPLYVHRATALLPISFYNLQKFQTDNDLTEGFEAL